MPKIPLQDRLRGAIWGQFIGDAAALGTHLVYDLNDYARRFSKDIQGFETPDAKHIHAGKKSGDFTNYGDAALVFLKSIARRQGFSARDFGTLFVESFASPDYPESISKTTRDTIENYHISLEECHPDLGYEFQGGANNADADTATRLAPLIALYWDDPKLLSIVDKATRVTQNNELAVAYMRCYARIVVSLLKGQELINAFQKESQSTPSDTPLDLHVREKISLALSLTSLDVKTATHKIGQKATLDNCFPAAIHAALKQSESFTEAVLGTIRAGGDNAGRAAMIGTWLGAHLGMPGIPKDWKQRLSHHNEIENDIESILNLKAHT